MDVRSVNCSEACELVNEACETNNVKKLLEILETICVAAQNNHTKMDKCLKKFDEALETEDEYGMTVLHFAAKHGKLDCCKFILKERPSMINLKDRNRWTPLAWACEFGQTEVVEFLIAQKPMTRIADHSDVVALHWAALSGCLGVVKSLVEYDPEVNMCNDSGDTALHIAARINSPKIVSYLLEKGALASIKNRYRKRPIDNCTRNSTCYRMLKRVPRRRRKRLVSTVTESETKQNPIPVKSTPVLISEDIANGREHFPIRCVNEIDDEAPRKFTYITENRYDNGIYVDSDLRHKESCRCAGDECNTSVCCCGENVYDENGRLKSCLNLYNQNFSVYECDSHCKCHAQCANRVIQKGMQVDLELYKYKDMGWGVRARQNILQGTFVCEYVGVIMTDQKANNLKEDSYLFGLVNPGVDDLYSIDAYRYGNVSRFINHSCDPNLIIVNSFINHQDKRFPRLAIFAVRDISQGEQLCSDYGFTFWNTKWHLFSCKCGHDNCRYLK